MNYAPFVSEYLIDTLLKRAVLYKQSLRFERVHQLLAEADALLTVMLTSEHYYHLLGFLILHYNHSVFEIEIHHYVFRGVDIEGGQSLLRNILVLNVLEKV